jgi:hypothetical protein
MGSIVINRDVCGASVLAGLFSYCAAAVVVLL